MLFEKCTITIAAMHHHLSSYSANAARLSPFISSRSAANAWAVSRQSSALLPPSPTPPLAARRQPYRLLIYACIRASFTQTPPSAPNLPPPSPTPLPLLLIVMIASYSRLLTVRFPTSGGWSRPLPFQRCGWTRQRTTVLRAYTKRAYN
jgi:hypothetical protein